MPKTTYTKLEPKKYHYRTYKNFDENSFLVYLGNILCKTTDISYSAFQLIFINALNKFAPLKTRYLRANNKPHITSDLRKAIMNKSRLKNIANKTKSPKDTDNYRKHRFFAILALIQRRMSVGFFFFFFFFFFLNLFLTYMMVKYTYLLTYLSRGI